MEQGIPVPNRLSLDFQQELVEHIDQIHYLDCLISSGRKEDALKEIEHGGTRLATRYTKICYYGVSFFTEDIPLYPVNVAATVGDVEIMKALISSGFDPKVQNHDILSVGCKGKSPLCCAAEKQHLDVVKFLIEDYNADVNEKDGMFGATPLHYACEGGSLEVVQYLVERGACVNGMDSLHHLPIVSALRFPHMCEYLMAEGTDVKLMDHTELSLLLFACTILSCTPCRHLETIRLIVEAGANVNNRNLCGETPISIAAYHNWLELMKLLYENGADPELVDMHGQTPLHRTTQYRKTTCAHYLVVDLSVTIDRKISYNQQTPFAAAVAEGNSNFLNLLLDAGYNPVNEDCIYENEKVELTEVLERARHIASNPHSLQDLCCFRIRQIMGRRIKRDVDKLHLPALLKDMIQLKHVLPHMGPCPKSDRHKRPFIDLLDNDL